MKKIIYFLMIFMMTASIAMAATKDIVPRADGEGSLGTSTYSWSGADINTVTVNTTMTVGGTTVCLSDGTSCPAAGGGLVAADIDTSAELKAIVTDETGTGGALVFATAPTLSSPVIQTLRTSDGGQIIDENSNQLLFWSVTASAVNEFTIKNAATGNAPQLQATGGDTNIDLRLVPKGSGKVVLMGDLTVSGDDIFMATNTSGAILVADGTNFNPVVASGDAVIATNGVVAIQANAVAMATDTTGDFVNSVTGGDGIDSTGATSGENISHTLAVALKTVAENAVGTTNSVSGLEFESGELTMLQGCSDGQILKWEETDDKWHCVADDSAGSITGTDTHVMFFDGADSPAGDAGMTYNKTMNVLTLTGSAVVADEVYDATDWNGEFDVPTKNAIRDKIETISATEVNNLETITTGIATTEIPIGTAADTAVYAALSGDVTMTNGGLVTIAANAVVLATDTSGAFVADLTATAEETTVSGGGAENATITIGLPDNVEVDGTLHVVGAVSTNSTVTVFTEGVKLTGLDGSLTFLGLGNGSDEDLTINLDDTSNEITLSTSTGALLLNLSGALDLKVAGGDITLGTTVILSGGDTTSLDNVDAINSTTETTIEAQVFDADAKTITGVWEVQDDVDFSFGIDADWLIQYDEAVDNQLLFITANTSAVATTDPMVEFLVGTTPTADQQVFGVAKGTQASNTALLTVDEDGDMIATGSGTFGGSGGITTSGTILFTGTSSIGWVAVDGTDNVACNTTCFRGCVFGVGNATGTAVTGILSCSDATADTCMCGGGS